MFLDTLKFTGGRQDTGWSSLTIEGSDILLSLVVHWTALILLKVRLHGVRSSGAHTTISLVMHNLLIHSRMVICLRLVRVE